MEPSLLITFPATGRRDRNLNRFVVPNTNKIYAVDIPYDAISVIDGKTNDMVGTINVNGAANDVAVNPLTSMLYVAGDSGNIDVIDGKTNDVVKTITLNNSSLDNIAVNTATNTIYVSNGNDDTISVIDDETNDVSKTFHVGKTPMDIAVNLADNTVYVNNLGDDSVSVISQTTK